MKHLLRVMFACGVGVLTGCASEYGAAEIRYTDYRYNSGDSLNDARAFPADRTLVVEGRVVDEFMDGFEMGARAEDRVAAPESVNRAVLVVPERDNPDSGTILELYAGGLEYVGIYLRDGDWKLIGTDFLWTDRLVKAWAKLLDQAIETELK
jgi:hypothetical protein